MQQQEFEQSISKFFEKAGVRLIKKGQGYEDKITFPAYLLLDIKRKAYYFTETDVQTIDDETAQYISQLSADTALSENTANALFRIGQDISENNNKFILESDDLSNLDSKAALIISEDNSAEIKEYLEKNDYKFQTVPLKNQFLVIFFDKGMEDNLISLYKKYAGSTLSNIEEDDDIAPVFTPKEDSSIDDIDLSVPKNNFDVEKPLVEPKIETPAENHDDKAEDELLDSIDLSDLLKPAQEDDTPKDETEAELLYGKLLNEQTDKIEVSASGPVEKTLDEIPAGIISDEDIKDMTSDNKKDEKNNDELDKKAAKLKEKEEKKLAKKREKEAAGSNSSYKAWLDIPGKIAANIIGIIFFLPVYILNKAAGRFLPPFVIYWLTAIIAIYGGYQFIFSLFPIPFASSSLNEANNAIALMQNYNINVPEGQSLNEIAQISISMIKNSAIMFYGLLKGFDTIMSQGYLLQYLLGFGAVMMIFPAFRFIGKSITIFSVLSYFLLPAVAYSQAFLIKQSFNLTEINLTAAAINFVVYIYPLLLLLAVLYISSALVPDKNTRKEVLP